MTFPITRNYRAVLCSTVVFLLVCLCVWLPLRGPLLDTSSDPLGTTVIAQSMLANGELSLSPKATSFFRRPDGTYSDQVYVLQGRAEYAFPLGAVVMAMPIVAVANRLGFDPIVYDSRLQKILVRLSTATIIGLTYLIARRSLSRASALVVSTLVVYGTVIGPTVGNAFWSINGELVCIGATMFLLTPGRIGGESAARPRPILTGSLVGICLFMGFLCRPSFAPFTVSIFLYLAWTSRVTLAAAAGIAGLLLLAFVFISERHFGTYLPPYYLASRLSFTNLRMAFFGLVFSPSRGVFVFSPVLLAVPFYLRSEVRRFPRALAPALMLGMAGQFMSNVLFPQWWGGYSYGPRILCDMVYIGCLSLLFVATAKKPSGHPMHPTLPLTMTGLLIIGAYVDIPGLRNDYTHEWNAFPSVDSQPAVLFDWRYPQFRATNRSRLFAKCLSQTKGLAAMTGAKCDVINSPGFGARE